MASGTSSACPGCGVVLPDTHGPTHDYLESTPACWGAFGEVLAREFSDAAYFVAHQDTVDAYAAQHPGVDARRQRQSVAVHLVALCLRHERGADPRALPELRRRVLAAVEVFPWLEPPRPGDWTVRVTDVLATSDADQHVRRAREWAGAVWAGWSAHHPTVAAWVDAIG